MHILCMHHPILAVVAAVLVYQTNFVHNTIIMTRQNSTFLALAFNKYDRDL